MGRRKDVSRGRAVARQPGAGTIDLFKVRPSNRKLPMDLRVQAYGVRGQAAPPEGRCGARLRQPPDFPAGVPHRFCGQHRQRGMKRCRIHGGDTPVGPALPQFTHGRYSQLFKKDGPLWRGYRAALSDSELLTLREQIRLVDAREQELLDRLTTDAPDTPALWREARQLAVQAMTAARAAVPDVTTMMAALARLEHITTAGGSQETVWEAWQNTTELRRKLVETEAKLLERGQSMVPVEYAVQYGSEVARAAVTAMQTEKTCGEALHRFLLELNARLAGARLETAEAAGEAGE